jgi:succinate dehydrogenase / fumarate reductase cytochrome b subunit
VSTTSKRPVYLNLVHIRLSVPGLMSIGHRISGVALILSLPWFAHLLALSLAGPEGFAQAGEAMESGMARLLLFLLYWGLLHHLFGGIRYLFLDLDLGVEKPVARMTAWAVMVGAPLVALLSLGVMR